MYAWNAVLRIVAIASIATAAIAGVAAANGDRVETARSCIAIPPCTGHQPP
jgi:hypothetical protein